jgi:prophage regulatory protein
MAEKFLRRPEVEKITGLPRSSIYERMAEGNFPKPVPLGGRSVAWLEAEIIDWQKRRIADRDRKGAGSRRRRHA